MAGVAKGLAAKITGFDATASTTNGRIGNTIKITLSNGDALTAGPIKQVRVEASSLLNTVPDTRDHYFVATIEISPDDTKFNYLPGAVWSVTIDGREFSYAIPSTTTEPETARTVARHLAAAINAGSKTFEAVLANTGSRITLQDRSAPGASKDPFTVEALQSGGGTVKVVFDIDNSNIVEGRTTVPHYIPYSPFGSYRFGGYGGFGRYPSYYNLFNPR